MTSGEPIGTHSMRSLEAARRLGDKESEATALANLGLALQEERRFEEAITAHQEAGAIFRQTGDWYHEGITLNNLGLALHEERRFEEAITAHQEAGTIFRQTGDRYHEGITLNNLGLALQEERRFEEAITAHQEAAAIIRQTRDRYHEAGTLNNLGLALHGLGRFEEAITACQEAGAIFRQTGDRQREGLTLNNLGLALHGLGRFEEAITACQEAGAIFRQTGDRQREGLTLNNLGVALREERRFQEAITAHQEAAAIFRQTGDRYREGLTLNNLGVALRRAGRSEAAIAVTKESVASFAEIGDRRGEGTALNRLGAALYEIGQFEDAIAAHESAAQVFRQIDDLDGIASALRYLRTAERAQGTHRSEVTVPVPDQVIPREVGSAGSEGPQGRGEGGEGGAGGNGSNGTADGGVGRYLMGRFPGTVRPEHIFSLLVSVIRSVGSPPEGGAPLKPFQIPTGGRLVTLIIDAPGLHVLDDHRQAVLVPPDGDSEPVKFDLIGNNPGPQRISVTAWDGGSYLGELAVEMSVERDGPTYPDRTVVSPAREERTEGEVTLLVRYDPHQAAYRFEFIDVDYPDEVTSQLVYDPGPAVERLVRRLNRLAEGTTGYSAAATRAYLVNEGVQLWQELIPEQLRSQFWERQRRITQLTILTNHDVVPWELLYPKDRRHDAGFLVNQFPVTRAIYGRAQERRLRLHPARFVVPPGSPSDARTEAETLARLLGTKLTTVSELMPLLHLISKGRFGLLHFACHNRFDSDDGSSIKLDSPFSPTFLATAASDQTLARAGPVIFINACRSLGQVPSYNKLDGWADKFMHAGAAAFIGSLWEVSDGAACEFAQELYSRLLDGDMLGNAVMAARHTIADEPGDPTWLAYAVYGDPRARIDLTTK